MINVSNIIYGLLFVTYITFGVFEEGFISKFLSYFDRLAISLLTINLIYQYFNNQIKLSKQILLFWVLVVIMTYRGLNSPYFDYPSFQPDLFLYLGIAGFMTLGYNLKYEKFIRFLILLLKVGLIINISAIFLEQSFLRSISDTGSSIAYKKHVLLFPAFFLVFSISYLKPKERLIVIASLLLLIVQIFLFQKRAYLLRFTLLISILFYVWSKFEIYKNNLIIANIKSKVRIYGWLIGIGIALLITPYIYATIDRFYIEDDVSTTIEQDARLLIGQELLNLVESSSKDMYFFGAGLGTAISLEEGGFRQHVEMGIPTILFKGGVVLLSFWLLVLFRVFTLFRKVKNQEILFSFYITIMVWFAFLYFEGYLTSIFNPNTLIIPFGVGLLLRIKENKPSPPIELIAIYNKF